MTNWIFKARELGYRNEGQMLYDLYVNMELNQRDIAKLLGVVKSSVERRMRECGVDPRGVGRRKRVKRSRSEGSSQSQDPQI